MTIGPLPQPIGVDGEGPDGGRDRGPGVLHQPLLGDPERLGAAVGPGHRLGRDRGQRGLRAAQCRRSAAQVHLEDGRVVGGQRRGRVGVEECAVAGIAMQRSRPLLPR